MMYIALMEVHRVKYRQKSDREMEYQPRHPARRAAKVTVHLECVDPSI